MKKYIMIVATLVISGGVLVGCNNDGGGKVNHTSSEHDAGIVEEVKELTMSEAFEEFPIWFRSRDSADELARDSNIEYLFYFEGDKVTTYKDELGFLGKIEEFRDLSKEEIIEKIESEANELKVYEHKYTLEHTLDSTGLEVEETDFNYTSEAAIPVTQQGIFQPLYEKFIVGFVALRYGSADKNTFFTIVEDGSVKINLGNPEEESKENITVE